MNAKWQAAWCPGSPGLAVRAGSSCSQRGWAMGSGCGLLGTVSTLDGARVIQSITAPAPGVPMFVTSSPAVAADGLLLGLGAE